MVTIQMDECNLLEMFEDRVRFWTDDEDIIKLYSKMYEWEIDAGMYDNRKVDVMIIVDNDWINYTEVLSDGDKYYDGIDELYHRQGLGDISCNHEENPNGYSYIEAEYKGMYLLRW